MKPLCVIAFIFCGCTWGWMEGSRAPARDCFLYDQQAAQSLNILVGLFGGLFFGAIGGALAARFLPKRFIFVPILLLILGSAPMVIVTITNQAEEVERAKMEVKDRARERATYLDSQKVLDSFTKATGWTEAGKNRISRRYNLSANTADTRAQLVSLGATEVQPFSDGISWSMIVPWENHRLLVQLSPTPDGGSHVMIQY